MPEQKLLLLGFLNFHQVLRRKGWMLTLPVFAGQDENIMELEQFYRSIGEWVNERVNH